MIKKIETKPNKQQLTWLVGENAALQWLNYKLTGQITNLAGQITDMTGQITDMTGQIDKLNTKDAQQNKQIADLESKLNEDTKQGRGDTNKWVNKQIKRLEKKHEKQHRWVQDKIAELNDLHHNQYKDIIKIRLEQSNQDKRIT